METKNGFEVVLTISETPIVSDDEPPVEPVEELFPPHAVRLSVPRVRTAPRANKRVATVRGAVELNIESPVSVARIVPDNDVMTHVTKLTRYSQGINR
jgi:hypothetical protein